LKGFVKVVKKYALRNKKEMTTKKFDEKTNAYDELNKLEEPSALFVSKRKEKNTDSMIKIIPTKNELSRVT
jgi:hypothetical protein